MKNMINRSFEKKRKKNRIKDKLGSLGFLTFLGLLTVLRNLGSLSPRNAAKHARRLGFSNMVVRSSDLANFKYLRNTHTALKKKLIGD